MRFLPFLALLITLSFSLPSYIEVSSPLTFTDEVINGNVTINFTSPSYVEFYGLSGSGALYIEGEGSLHLYDSNVALQVAGLCNLSLLNATLELTSPYCNVSANLSTLSLSLSGGNVVAEGSTLKGSFTGETFRATLSSLEGLEVVADTIVVEGSNLSKASGRALSSLGIVRVSHSLFNLSGGAVGIYAGPENALSPSAAYVEVNNTTFLLAPFSATAPEDTTAVRLYGSGRIEGSSFHGYANGIFAFFSQLEVLGSFFNNSHYGLSLEQQPISCSNLFIPGLGRVTRCIPTTSSVRVCNNTFVNNTYPLWLDEGLYDSELCNNTIVNSTIAIILWDPLNVSLGNNSVEGAEVGLLFSMKDGEGLLRVEGNTFSNTGVAIGPVVVYGRYKTGSLLATFSANAFANGDRLFYLFQKDYPSDVVDALSPPAKAVVNLFSSWDGFLFAYPQSYPSGEGMEVRGLSAFLPNVVASSNAVPTVPVTLTDVFVASPTSGVEFPAVNFSTPSLLDVVRGEGDTGSIYLGEGIISIDTATEPALAGLNAILYFKVPSCSYIFRVWFTDTFTRSSDDVKALGRLLTTPTQCSYDERMQSYVLKVPVTIQ